MKTTLYLATLLLGFSACSGKKDDPTVTDPFLGHWQGETLRSVVYTPAGTVSTDQSTPAASQLDITPTTITFTSVTNGRTSTEVDTYTHNGELLTLTPPSGNPGKETVYARNLTPTNFTMEFNGQRVSGKTYYIQSLPYHR
jgi:hypothetical protein